jgi:hypothetical protein
MQLNFSETELYLIEEALELLAQHDHNADSDNSAEARVLRTSIRDARLRAMS